MRFNSFILFYLRIEDTTVLSVVYAANVLLLLIAIYIIWRLHRYSRELAEKNLQLYERIRQLEHHEEEALETLAAQPEETQIGRA